MMTWDSHCLTKFSVINFPPTHFPQILGLLDFVTKKKTINETVSHTIIYENIVVTI